MPIRKLIAAVAVLALQASFAGAGEPGGTPDELYFSEAAAAGAVGIAFFAAGYAVGGDPKDNEGGTREKLSYAVYGVAPLASALAVYVVGENVGHPSANRGKVLLATAGTFYAVIGTAAGAAYLLTDEDSDAGALTAAFYTVIPAGFLGAAVYNAVKKPHFYDIPGYSITVEPSMGLCRTSGENGEVVPTWGVTVSF
jgi:hypothetical protein